MDQKNSSGGAERYITEELKNTKKNTRAEEKYWCRNPYLQRSGNGANRYIQAIQQHGILSQIGVLYLCYCCEQNEYIKPSVSEENFLRIKEGRHPVIEQELPIGESYISNSVYLDREEQQIIIITGPNMSGKSALLRQTALIVLMAQIGCFVPAKAAEIGYVDKIFTRVGASDNISLESTFMVEMNEAASILNNLLTGA